MAMNEKADSYPEPAQQFFTVIQELLGIKQDISQQTHLTVKSALCGAYLDDWLR